MPNQIFQANRFDEQLVVCDNETFVNDIYELCDGQTFANLAGAFVQTQVAAADKKIDFTAANVGKKYNLSFDITSIDATPGSSYILRFETNSSATFASTDTKYLDIVIDPATAPGIVIIPVVASARYGRLLFSTTGASSELVIDSASIDITEYVSMGTNYDFGSEKCIPVQLNYNVSACLDINSDEKYFIKITTSDDETFVAGNTEIIFEHQRGIIGDSYFRFITSGQHSKYECKTEGTDPSLTITKGWLSPCG